MKKWNNGDDSNRTKYPNRRAERIISNCLPPTNSLVTQLNCLSILEGITHPKPSVMYGIMNGLCPQYFVSLFTLVTESTYRQFSSTTNSPLFISEPNSRYLLQRVSYIGPKIWNPINTQRKRITCVSSF